MKDLQTIHDNRPRGGISLLEVIASIVILSVIAAASVASMQSQKAGPDVSPVVQADLQLLAALTQTYRIETGRYPRRGINELIDAGYLPPVDAVQKNRHRRLTAYDYDPHTGKFAVPRRRTNIGTSVHP